MVLSYCSSKPYDHLGELVEWFMSPVLKTGDQQWSVGSNPTLSARTAPSSIG
jgi:hypothetical protein